MAYNLIAGFNPGSVRLPSAGGELCTLTLSRVGIEDNDPNILRAMLSHLIQENLGKGYHLLTLGFTAEDPLIQAVHGFPLVQVLSLRSTVSIAELSRLNQRDNFPIST